MIHAAFINGQPALYNGPACADAFTARTKVPGFAVPAPALTAERIARARLEQKATILDLDLEALERFEIGLVASEIGHADEGVRPHNNLQIVSEARRRVAQRVEHLYVQEGHE